jgi:hypothetical protein
MEVWWNKIMICSLEEKQIHVISSSFGAWSSHYISNCWSGVE